MCTIIMLTAKIAESVSDKLVKTEHPSLENLENFYIFSFLANNQILTTI